MILDVGCGINPQGDVNVDLFLNEESPDIHMYIDAKQIPNPVKADAHSLPFRGKSFAMVCCRALLEHVDNPTQALREMLRVAKRLVKFTVPHRFFRTSWLRGQPKLHKHFFSVAETNRWIRRLGYRPMLDVEYKSFPTETIPIFRLPWLIHVKIKLRE